MVARGRRRGHNIAMSDITDDQVVITRAEHDELLAYRAADSRRRPAEVAAMIAGGDSPLRAWRRYRGLTQVQLAEAGAIGQGYLSELEAGGKEGSWVTMRFLARALGVAPDALLPGIPQRLR
jgi:hypothetical protein